MTPSPAGPTRAQAMERLAAALAQPLGGEGLAKIARALAALAPNLGPEPAPIPDGLRERMLSQAPPPSDPPQAALGRRAGARVIAFMLDLCAAGSAAAMDRCLTDLATEPDGPALLTVMTSFLDPTGLARDLPAQGLEDISARHLPPSARPAFANAALGLLGLSKTAAFPARRLAFLHAAAPYMRRAAQAGAVNALLAAESAAYESYLKTVETPEHHKETFAVIEGAFALLSPSPTPAAPERPEGRRPRLAFLIPHGGMLAHAEVLLSFLTGLKRLDDAPIEALVLMHGALQGGELGQKLDQIGVRWEALGPAPSLEARFDRMRQRIADLDVDAAVVVSLPLHLAYFCRRPVAPRLIWWSMKFALPNFERLDGRVFYRSLFDRAIQIDGKVWRGGPLAFGPPARPPAETVEAIRARFPGKTILGTIAREEKIANRPYLDAIVDLLRRHPDTCFLWTGRAKLPEVQDVFVQAGVDDRCHFIGWVDPAPYLLAFDLFIETYPLTGLMSGWAMALGQPIVSVGPLGFVGTYLGPVLDGSIPSTPDDIARIEAIFAPIRDRLPGLWADHPDQIGAFADALLADPQLRRDLGQAQRGYVETFLADEAGSAATQARHFADILREPRTAG